MTTEDVDSFALYLKMKNAELEKLKKEWPRIEKHSFVLLKNWQNAAHDEATCTSLLNIIKIKECCREQ